MNTKNLIAPLLLSLLVGLAHADPGTSTNSVVLVPHGGNTWSAGFSTTHTEIGSFTDIFTLTGIDADVTIDGLLSTMGGAASSIDFTSVSLNGYDFSLMPIRGGGERALLGAYEFSGPLVLTVTGTVGGGAARDSAVAATYSGSFNVVADVPEPTGLALVGIGLAAAAFARRRKSSI